MLYFNNGIYALLETLKKCLNLRYKVFLLRIKCLSLEGCSLLTTEGLESAVLSWTELQDLRAILCKNIKDSEVSPALSTLSSILKELKWSPDTKSLLASNLAGTGMGKRGGKFFKKA
ncbi:hypothetical protein ACOSP7_027138 [Xanthoceras sorbifolium]